MGCVFCAIVDGTEPAEILHENSSTLVIVPLSPVVAGHVLIIPTRHVTDAAQNSGVTGSAFEAAADWARSMDEPFNLITSAGAAATQTVGHLHVHYVPRADGDGLALPWSAG